jgi:capsular exopolysaccharide synthesis family protein
MDLSVYYKPLLRMWWLLIAAALVAAISTFIVLRQQPAVYQAKTTLMIGRIIDDPNPSSDKVYLAQQLAFAYVDVANRKPIQEATMKALGLNRLPDYYVQAVPNGITIEVIVTDTNPLRAQAVANELANQLILRSPAGELSDNQVRQDFVNEQIDNVQAQIVETQNEINSLQDKVATINSASELQNLENQISAQTQKLTLLQGTYANLLLNTQQGSPNTLIIVESAELPTRPIGQNKTLLILLAAGIGFVFAAGAAYLLDYLDDTLKTPEDVKRWLGIPVLGLIGETRSSEGGKNGLYVSKNPRSPVAEAYRSLRANLQFLGEDQPLKSILITSTDIGVGKTSVAANLAAIYAQGRKSVILLDADLRKPSIHEYVKIPNDFGLADILLDGTNVDAAITDLESVKVGVIPSGQPYDNNPEELLTSEKMDQILEILENKVDFVIVDSPPMIVSDALFVSAKVDGVLIVLRPGYTRRKAVVAMLEQFRRADARVLGVVLNGIAKKEARYYGGTYYYSTAYPDKSKSEESERRESQGHLNRYLGQVQERIGKLRSKVEED